MDVSEAKQKVKDVRIQEIMWKIDHNQVKDEDEWLQFAKEMDAYVKTDIPEDVKRLFYPLGYLEITTIVIDGIIRWRNSICIRCRKQQGCDKYSCSVYQKDDEYRGGIPSEIWARGNAQCPYFEE
ncbi:MAG: hypothetical protein K2N94_07810 [Lachnospiraceae bacterium]|nr:hypothetical protein [Lachnospiraceae bacterium]